MCTADHKKVANPGYLIDAPFKSIAAEGVVFSRLLSHHREVGLATEQIVALLDLNREYHERQMAIHLEFGGISEEIELKRGRVDAVTIQEREALLRRHAELFLEEERFFLEIAMRGHKILTDEQIRIGDQIYHAEKDEMLGSLLPSLQRAAAPNFGFVRYPEPEPEVERMVAAG